MNNLKHVALGMILLTSFYSCSTGEKEDTNQIKTEIKTEIKMDITDIKNQYDLQTRLFNNVLKDITDEEANKKIIENTNNIAWIAGHTLDIQYNIAMMVGVASENPYGEQFGFGKPFDPNSEYPSVDKLLSDWNALTPEIKSALENLSNEKLTGDLPFEIPFKEQNLKGFLAFQMHHLGYEIGQIGLYRKFLGKESMSYQ